MAIKYDPKTGKVEVDTADELKAVIGVLGGVAENGHDPRPRSRDDEGTLRRSARPERRPIEARWMAVLRVMDTIEKYGPRGIDGAPLAAEAGLPTAKSLASIVHDVSRLAKTIGCKPHDILYRGGASGGKPRRWYVGPRSAVARDWLRDATSTHASAATK